VDGDELAADVQGGEHDQAGRKANVSVKDYDL
jgi:hypothetical protein